MFFILLIVYTYFVFYLTLDTIDDIISKGITWRGYLFEILPWHLYVVYFLYWIVINLRNRSLVGSGKNWKNLICLILIASAIFVYAFLYGLYSLRDFS